MKGITGLFASMKLWQYILLYVACFVLAMVIAAAGSEKNRSFRESLIAVLALLGGALAVGYVTCRLGKNPGILILAVLAIPAAIIGYPAAMAADHGKAGNKNPPPKEAPPKKAPAPVPPAPAKQQPPSDKLTSYELNKITEIVKFGRGHNHDGMRTMAMARNDETWRKEHKIWNQELFFWAFDEYINMYFFDTAKQETYKKLRDKVKTLLDEGKDLY